MARTRPVPAMVGSYTGTKALPTGVAILRKGGSALDAVEACARHVEDDLEDLFVGMGSTPNVMGEVELDGTIMDGTTLRVGAVAGMKNHPHAVTVARAIMENLPHVMLVGDGAGRYADEIGETRAKLTQPKTQREWLATLKRARQTPASMRKRREIRSIVERIMVTTHGTVDFIAIDRKGNIATAVSTSGWPFKYPGRVGDSGIIGAGNYSDSRYGGAVTVGLGELAIRRVTCKTAVDRLAAGMSVKQAAAEAIADINALPEKGIFTIHVLGANGEHCAAANIAGRRYCYQNVQMERPDEPARTFIRRASKR